MPQLRPPRGDRHRSRPSQRVLLRGPSGLRGRGGPPDRGRRGKALSRDPRSLRPHEGASPRGRARRERRRRSLPPVQHRYRRPVRDDPGVSGSARNPRSPGSCATMSGPGAWTALAECVERDTRGDGSAGGVGGEWEASGITNVSDSWRGQLALHRPGPHGADRPGRPHWESGAASSARGAGSSASVAAGRRRRRRRHLVVRVGTRVGRLSSGARVLSRSSRHLLDALGVEGLGRVRS